MKTGRKTQEGHQRTTKDSKKQGQEYLSVKKTGLIVNYMTFFQYSQKKQGGLQLHSQNAGTYSE
jgi:hypothetical protein